MKLNRENIFSLETPFLDEEVFETAAAEDAGGSLAEHQIVEKVTFDSGEKLTVTSGPELPGEEYFDPFPGNPLLDVSGSSRAKRLSRHFTAHEFARSGTTTFAKARIDPDLVVCLQKVRDFIKEPLTILDGYYTWKHLLELTRKRGRDKPPISAHLSGRGAKVQAKTLSALELAKAILFTCADATALNKAFKDTTISVGLSSVAIYIKQHTPAITSYIKDGGNRDRTLQILRQYHELVFSDKATQLSSVDGFSGIRDFVHWAIHDRQIRDEDTIADVAFYRSGYAVTKRLAQRVLGRFERRNEVDQALRAEIIDKAIRPALAEVIAPPAQHGGAPGTAKGKFVLSDPQPDRPTADITGRYETIHPDTSEEFGKTMCINQAGMHIEVVVSPVNSVASPRDKQRYHNRYYGDIDGGTFRVFSRNDRDSKFRFIPRGTSVEFEFSDGWGGILFEKYDRVSDTPILLEQGVTTFGAGNKTLLESAEWHPLLRRQLNHLRAMFGDEVRIGKFLRDYVDAEGGFLQPHDEHFKAKAVQAFGAALANHLKDPQNGIHPSDSVLALFYIRLLISTVRWKPSKNYPDIPALEWAQRLVAVTEYQCKHHGSRTGSVDPSVFIDDLVATLGLRKGTDTGGHLHTYRITMKLSGFAIGVGVLRGTITIEKTDEKKWPHDSVSFRVWFGLMGVSFKFRRKKGGLGPLKVGETITGTASSYFYWLPHDFPGRVNLVMGEASASAHLSADAQGGFLHIYGRGILPMLDVVFGEASVGVHGSPGISGELLGALGKIRDKDLPDIEYPLTQDKTDYAITHGLKTQAAFQFDSAVLESDARQALRVMCANELVTLMNPDSVLDIDGHTDSKSTHDYNLALSAARAANTQQALMDILGSKLVCSVRPRGHGEREATEAGEKERRNLDRRRVELKLNGRLVLRLGDRV